MGPIGPPFGGDGVGQRACVTVGAAASAVGPDKIRVAEPALRAGAVSLPPGPEIAAGKPAEYGRASRMGAFALQRKKYFLHRIGHSRRSFRLRPILGVGSTGSSSSRER